MDKEQVLEYLSTEEGQQLAEELKQPLLTKKDEILREKKELESKYQAIVKEEQDRLHALSQEKKSLEEKRMKDENDFESFKTHMEQEIANKEERFTTMQKRYADTEINRIIGDAASKHSNSPKPLQLLLKERIRPVITDSGDIDYVVKDTNGKDLYWEGEPARINHLIEELKGNEDYTPFFAPSGVSGSGTKQSQPVSANEYKDMNSSSFNLSKAMGNKI